MWKISPPLQHSSFKVTKKYKFTPYTVSKPQSRAENTPCAQTWASNIDKWTQCPLDTTDHSSTPYCYAYLCSTNTKTPHSIGLKHFALSPSYAYWVIYSLLISHQTPAHQQIPDCPTYQQERHFYLLENQTYHKHCQRADIIRSENPVRYLTLWITNWGLPWMFFFHSAKFNFVMMT